MEIYQRNIESLKRFGLRFVEVLNKTKADDEVEVVSSRSGLPTLKLKGEDVFLLSKYDPKKEAERLVEKLDLSLGNSIVIFGFGLGYHLIELAKRANKGMRFRIIEKRRGLFKTAMENVDLTPIFNSGRVEKFFLGAPPSDVADGIMGGRLEEIILLEHPPLMRRDEEYYNKIKEKIPLKQISLSTRRERRKKISACMITLNEEEMIEESLKALVPLVDEVIVVDGGSTDQTVRIISKYSGVKLIHNPWPKDFSIQFNVALKHATGDWILNVAADEKFEPNLALALPHLLESEFTNFWFPIINFWGNREVYNSDFVPSYKKRLFQNQPGIHFRNTRHPIITNVKGRAGFILDVHLLHYGFTRSKAAIEEKFKRYDEWGIGIPGELEKLTKKDYRLKKYSGYYSTKMVRIVDYYKWRKEYGGKSYFEPSFRW